MKITLKRKKKSVSFTFTETAFIWRDWMLLNIKFQSQIDTENCNIKQSSLKKMAFHVQCYLYSIYIVVFFFWLQDFFKKIFLFFFFRSIKILPNIPSELLVILNNFSSWGILNILLNYFYTFFSKLYPYIS